MRVKTILAALTLTACAQGIDPPEATSVAGIAAGTFTLGSTNFDPCKNSRVADNGGILECSSNSQSELVRAEASFDNFCIDVHEVTVDQFRHCVARGDCGKPDSTNAGNRGDGFIEKYYGNADRYGNYPVLGVSWDEANSYCAFRGGRLPTEVEWEYVATSRGTRPQVFEDADTVADIAAGCAENKNKVAFGPCSENEVREVATSSKDVTAQGVFDMAGNAQEWTADEFDYLAYCDSDQPGGASLTDLFVVDDEKVVPKANGSYPDALLKDAPDACLDSEDVGNNRYTGLCTDQTEACLKVCVDAWDTNAQTSEKQDNWQTFDCQARFDADDCDCGAPSDECQAQCDCLADPRSPADDDAGCIAACVDEFTTCAADCTEAGVVTACVRVNGSRPAPLCKPRTYGKDAAAKAHSTPEGLLSDAIRGRHVARGAHFQDDEACDLRPTRRVPKNVSSPLVGFRCAYDRGQGACR